MRLNLRPLERRRDLKMALVIAQLYHDLVHHYRARNKVIVENPPVEVEERVPKLFSLQANPSLSPRIQIIKEKYAKKFGGYKRIKRTDGLMPSIHNPVFGRYVGLSKEVASGLYVTLHELDNQLENVARIRRAFKDDPKLLYRAMFGRSPRELKIDETHPFAIAFVTSQKEVNKHDNSSPIAGVAHVSAREIRHPLFSPRMTAAREKVEKKIGAKIDLLQPYVTVQTDSQSTSQHEADHIFSGLLQRSETNQSRLYEETHAWWPSINERATPLELAQTLLKSYSHYHTPRAKYATELIMALDAFSRSKSASRSIKEGLTPKQWKTTRQAEKELIKKIPQNAEKLGIKLNNELARELAKGRMRKYVYGFSLLHDNATTAFKIERESLSKAIEQARRLQKEHGLSDEFMQGLVRDNSMPFVVQALTAYPRLKEELMNKEKSVDSNSLN